jgi:hypothetical protein
VRASVALSYQGLGATERRAFRLLGLLEVPDFAPWVLAALLEVPAAQAEDILERLADAQLLDTVGEDPAGQLRYRFHDLLRLYARERLAEQDTQPRATPPWNERCRPTLRPRGNGCADCGCALRICLGRPCRPFHPISPPRWRGPTGGWPPSARVWW